MENQNQNTNSKGEAPISPNIEKKESGLSTGNIPEENLSNKEEVSKQREIPREPEEKIKESEPIKITPPPLKAPEKETKTITTKKETNIKGIIIIVSIIISVIVIAALAVYFYLANYRKVPLTIKSNQEIIDLVIGENEYKNVSSPHIIKLLPGEYSVSVSREDFFPITKTVNVDALGGDSELEFQLIEKQSIEKIFDKEVFYSVYDDKTNSFLYFSGDEEGDLFLNEYDLDSREETTLTDRGIVNIQNDSVVWSPSFKQVIVKVSNSPVDNLFPFIEDYGTGVDINWIINLERRDLVNITTKHLHPTIKDVSFSPTGEKIFYFFKNDAERTLAMANNDGSDFERIVQLKNLEFDPDVVWSPDGDKIAIYISDGQRESGEESYDLYIYSISKREITKITDDGLSYEALFSPSGEKILYKSGGNIWAYDFAQGEGSNINLEVETSTENCIWLDDQNIITSNKEGLWQIMIGGERKMLDYKKDTLPNNIKSIKLGVNEVFLISDSGIYQITFK